MTNPVKNFEQSEPISHLPREGEDGRGRALSCFSGHASKFFIEANVVWFLLGRLKGIRHAL